VNIAAVTVLEDRARVTRRGAVQLPAGQSTVKIEGVAPVLVDKTLTARAEQGRVLDVRCRRALAPEHRAESARSADATELRARLDAAEVAVARAEGEQAIADRELGAIVKLRAVSLEELADEAAWGRPIDGAAAALKRLDEQEKTAVGKQAAQRLAVERARRDLAELRARAAEAARDAGRDTATIEIDLALDAAAEVALEVEYLVPGACWRPYHTATLAGDQVTIATDACVWQRTGEDWRDAALSFSTERPSLGAEPPRLFDDPVRVQKKSEQLVVEARDHDVDQTGLGAADRPQQQAAQVPGVDDGGVVQTLRAPHPASVVSDGRPYRVPLGSHTSPAEVALVAVPERSAAVFTRTRQANGGRPLLAGPVDLVRDAGYVGRTSTLFVASNEKFELGWGPDADLRLHRDERRHREDAGMLGSWNETRVRVAVRLSNLGDRARTVEVTERVPVSEIDKVEIKLGAPDAWSGRDPEQAPDGVPQVVERTVDADGLVRWRVELPPRDRRLVALEYHVRAHTSVVGI
jgi:uncharacterized protein (TIGR02231 family)